jgi:hypothetical protein
MAFGSWRNIASKRSPKAALRSTSCGIAIPASHPVLTTDFFEFGTDKNALGEKGVAVEMDDAVLGLACEDLGAAAPKWASIRNYSDPVINGALAMKDQENLFEPFQSGSAETDVGGHLGLGLFSTREIVGTRKWSRTGEDTTRAI